MSLRMVGPTRVFPISRDPPEGGTPCFHGRGRFDTATEFPISRDPPEGGTLCQVSQCFHTLLDVSNF